MIGINVMGNIINTPSFIGIGAQRAGTTWLHECLKEHPEVFLPDEKEVHYFDRFYEKGFQWYLSKFNDANGNLCGEITPNYYHDENALERIKKDLPKVKIIYILREPIARAHSQFQLFSQDRYKGRTFNDVLRYEPVISNLSMQGKYLQKLNCLFNKEQVLVLLYDELSNNPEMFLHKVFDFLSIDPNFTPSHLNTRMNRIVLPGLQNKFRKIGLGWFIDLIKKSPLSEFIKDRFHSVQQEKNNQTKTGQLTTRFNNDIEIIESELGVNLSHWKK
jgi:hypothetical protein